MKTFCIFCELPPFNHLTLRQNSFITIIVFQCNIPFTEIIGHGHAKAENIIYLDLHDPAPDLRVWCGLGTTKKLYTSTWPPWHRDTITSSPVSRRHE